jgi:hypothetical protein
MPIYSIHGVSHPNNQNHNGIRVAENRMVRTFVCKREKLTVGYSMRGFMNITVQHILKSYLTEHAFYSFEEYYQFQ